MARAGTGQESSMLKLHIRRQILLVALLITAALSLTACGNSDEPGAAGSSGAAMAGCSDAVSTFLKPYEQLPTKLAPTLKPLAAAPEPGGLIVKITNGNITGDVRSSDAAAAAA